MKKSDGFAQEELDRLRRTRDELAVQAKLAKAELRDRWESLEKRWYELEGRLKVIGEGARQDAGEVREAAKLLVEELRQGYDHFKSRL